MKFLSTLMVLIVMAVLAGLYAPGGIEPVAWKAQSSPELTGVWQINDRLDAAVAEQRGLPGPDTVIVGPDGMRYTGVGDGRILRWRVGEVAGTFVTLQGRPVGMNFGPDGTLYAADEEHAVIWRISPQGEAERLVDRIGERRFRFLNDVMIAQDNRLFFTESTSRWGLGNNKRALLEHGGDGGVFVRHPDGRIEQLLDGLEFANGVMLSADESYLLVAETGAYRITRLWLAGPRQGEREILLDNLPGFPGDLSRAPDDSFWCSFFSPRKPLLDRLADKPWARRLLARLPLTMLPKPQAYPFVFRFDGNGQILETLQDATDTQRPSFSSVVQHGNDLLMGTPGGVGEIDADTAWRVSLSAGGVEQQSRGEADPVMLKLFSINSPERLRLQLPESEVQATLTDFVQYGEREYVVGDYADEPESGQVIADYLNIHALNHQQDGQIYFVMPFAISNQGSGVFHYLALLYQDVEALSVTHRDSIYLGDRISEMQLTPDPGSSWVDVEFIERDVEQTVQRQRIQIDWDATSFKYQ